MPRLSLTSLVLLLVQALPAIAGDMAPDAGKVDCRQLLEMSEAGQVAVAMAAKDALRANAYIQSLSDEDVLHLALAACSKSPDAKVLSVVTTKN